MAKVIFAEPGSNPMELHQIRGPQTIGKIKLLVAILALVGVCVMPTIFIARNVIAKPAPSSTPTVTQQAPSPSPTLILESTTAPSSTPTVTQQAPSPTPRPALTQTPYVVTQVVTRVVTRVVNVPGSSTIIEKHFEVTRVVNVTQVVTQIVTATPEPTQTPWIIEVTRLVEVTPTPTETPTETPTATPTATIYPVLSDPPPAPTESYPAP